MRAPGPQGNDRQRECAWGAQIDDRTWIANYRIRKPHHVFARQGSLSNPVDLKVTRPRELGGTNGRGTNPEQLFAACYAACFRTPTPRGTTFLFDWYSSERIMLEMKRQSARE